MNDGSIVIGTELDTKKFDKQIEKVERRVNEIEKELSQNKELGFLSPTEVADLNVELEKAKNKLISLRQQKEKATKTNDVNLLSKSFKNIGDSLQSAVKKAGKLTLAIFGIRGAYMMLKRASSDLASYDEQYATNLEYIRFVLTQAIAPILKYIVNLAMQLLGYINAILQAWFGVNLFANGSVEAFQKMKKGATGVGKAVKEIKKQLLGFDEVNVLSSQSDTGTSAGAGGVSMPNFDLSAVQGQVPDWLKWIIDNKEIILAVLAGIATGLTLIKFGMSGIKALGFGVMVAGIVYSIESLVKYMNDPSWKNFGNIIKGIGVALLGLGIIIGSVPVAVAGAIAIILGLIVSNWEQIKGTLQGGIDWLIGKVDWVEKNFGIVGEIIYKQILNIAQFILNCWDNVFTTWKNILDGVIMFFKGVFTGNWEQAWEGLKKIGQSVIDGLKQHFQNFWNFFSRVFENMKDTAVNVFWLIADGIKGAINSIIGGINTFISGINRISIKIPDWSPINPGAELSFHIPNIPKLKVGAIINMPNKGTYVGGGQAIGGEAGREGILPLTDQQAMAELGREIGKNVLINLTNIMQMNGRVIGREMKQVTNTQDFAYNR